jgi:hypothetical protein
MKCEGEFRSKLVQYKGDNIVVKVPMEYVAFFYLSTFCINLECIKVIADVKLPRPTLAVRTLERQAGKSWQDSEFCVKVWNKPFSCT